MRPAINLLKAGIGWCLAAAVINCLAIFASDDLAAPLLSLWWLSGVVLLVIAVYEYSRKRQFEDVEIERKLPPGFSVGTDNQIVLHVHNTRARPMVLTLTELVDDSVHIQGLPLRLFLQANEKVALTISVKPLQRGNISFDGIDTLIETPWRFWQTRQRYLAPTTVKVFPNFSAISHFELLAHGQQVGQLGIHMSQRRGEGLDFHQLREFRPGDSLRQVDWKATSRTLKPISREFQDERDQEIIFMLDNGRRMRAKDGELSHFDHCLNAFLLTSYVALRQGDAVGFQTFGGDQRKVSPIKGKNNLNTLLHQVFDVHSSVATSDYLSAAQNLMNSHRKRSLVIVISNVHDQDRDDLLAAYQLMSRNHLVIFACLRENGYQQKLDTPVEHFDQALQYSAAYQYDLDRQSTIRRLTASGAIVLDANPSHLHIALVNEYYALKRSGRI